MTRPSPRAAGALRMRSLAANFPNQLLEGFRAGQEAAPPAADRPTTVYFVGMGGSAIAADLARSVVENETSLTVRLVRSPELPRGVDRRARVVLVSYSGNTWETVRAYEAAGRAGASRVVIASGGELAERAAHDDVPLLLLPPGTPPRSAVGNTFGGILGLLDPWFPESNEARLARIVARLRRLVPQYAGARGPAARIAARLARRTPVIYAETAFGGVARRWKTQIEENAKQLATFDEAPELLHNAIVAWDAISAREARRYGIVLIEWTEEAAITRRAFRHFERLASARGASVTPVELAPEDRLDATLAGVSLGDHVSLFLAERRRVDPLPFDAIGRLKAALHDPRA